MSRSTSPATPRPDPNRARFPKSARLRLTHEFALVRQSGRSVQGKLLRMAVYKQETGGEARFGVVTSRRVGGAVERNKVRRRLRDLFRVHRSELSRDILLVVVAKSSAAGAGFSEIREEWLLLARRLSILPRS